LTMDRDELYRRIDLRVDRMVENGLVEEVERLLEAGVPRTAVSMQGLGYKETAAYLQGECTLSEAVERIKTGTRHFAKRQLTWLKQEKDVIWIDRGLYAGTEEIADDLCERIRTHYK
ncbi:MAG: tRNA (adenosine(37)-N6)-dimethylallyltransferase MiaA, partial [Lachnospiraceae bacterium]|nr:tRNA (adenosine(37)-N6)-dimethylallyltransferase MiaA [Lachnospiraceae bacterium]